MKKMITGFAMLISSLAFSGANAQQPAYDDMQPVASGTAYTCRIDGSMKGGGLAIGVGGQVLKGNGVITCKNNHSGEVISQDVKLRMAGGGVGFEIVRVKNVNIVTAGIAVNDPSYFFDNFSIGAEAGASLVRAGVSFDMAVRLAGKDGVGFDVGFQGKEIRGLGAHLYAMAFRITPR